MLKILFAALVVLLVSAGANAQSQDCCSKDKSETSQVSKHCDVPEKVSKETGETAQTTGALSDDKTSKPSQEIEVKKTTVAVKKDKNCCSTGKKQTSDKPSK